MGDEMCKIIKIVGNKVYIGKDDGSIIETNASNMNWDIKVGDKVEVFSNEDFVAVNLVKKVKEKKEIIPTKFSNLFKIIFPILFTWLIVLCVICFCVFSKIPHGKEYRCKFKIEEMDVIFIVNLLDEEMFAETVYSIGKVELKTETSKSYYKVENGKLYELQEIIENGKAKKEYVNIGDISSHKLVLRSNNIEKYIPELKDISTNAEITIELKERYVHPIKTILIVVMIIFIILCLTSYCFVILIKIKNKKIKTSIKSESKIISTEIKSSDTSSTLTE